MTEPTTPASDASARPPSDRLSTQAIVTYVLLLQFNLVGAGIFALIMAKVDVSPVMLGVLGGLITAVTASVSGATGYWLGSSAGSKSASATIAQLAGAPTSPAA